MEALKRIVNIFISTIYFVYIQTVFFIRRRKGFPYCIILYYHSIPNGETERFIQQMQILKKLTTPIPINYDGAFNNMARYSMVTFDDAFKSVVKNALPVMLELKIPFTIFIPAAYLGTSPGWLKNIGDCGERETVLSVEELSKLPKDIVTFGSHTVNHADLNREGLEKACYEIEESKKILESKLKGRIDYFAFPYGRYNSKLIECCRKVGYKQVFSIIPESPLLPLRKYLKGRVEASPLDWELEFILKILGGYSWRTLMRARRKTLKAS
jgi:peptidoglycan/xylan/chitin deacetylase (PgdA/CDA1 family)